MVMPLVSNHSSRKLSDNTSRFNECGPKVRLTEVHPAEALYRSFAAAATEATDRVKAFQAHMKSDAVKTILEHASESRKAQSGGIEPWRVTAHPDWLEGTKHSSGEGLNGAKSSPKASVDDATDEAKTEQNEQKALKLFSDAHPSVRLTTRINERTTPATRSYQVL